MQKLEAAEKERDALRAKITAMEKQEPIGLFARIDGDGPLMECRHADISRMPLYALPGAQPAPSIPEDMIVEAAERFPPDDNMAFTPTENPAYNSPHWPGGTDLLNSQQAQNMLRAAIDAAPEAKL